MKTSKGMIFALALTLLLTTMLTSVQAAPTAVENVSLNFSRDEIVRVSLFNNDSVVPGTTGDRELAIVRLYNAKHELLTESEAMEVPRGEVRVVDFTGAELARFGSDQYGRVHALVEFEYLSATPGRKGARWQTTIDVFDAGSGRSLIGLLLPAVQKVR